MSVFIMADSSSSCVDSLMSVQFYTSFMLLYKEADRTYTCSPHPVTVALWWRLSTWQCT